MSSYEDHIECQKCKFRFHKHCYKEDLKENLIFEDELSIDLDSRAKEFICQECEWSSEDKQKEATELQNKLMADLTALKKKNVIFKFNYDVVKIILEANNKANKILSEEIDVSALLQEFITENEEFFESEYYKNFLNNMKILSKCNSFQVSKSRKSKSNSINFQKKTFELYIENKALQNNSLFLQLGELADLFFGMRAYFTKDLFNLLYLKEFSKSLWKIDCILNLNTNLVNALHVDENNLHLLNLYFEGKTPLETFDEIAFEENECFEFNDCFILFQEIKYGMILLRENLKYLELEMCEKYEKANENEMEIENQDPFTFFLSDQRLKISNILVEKSMKWKIYNPFLSLARLESSSVNKENSNFMTKDSGKDVDSLLDYEEQGSYS